MTSTPTPTVNECREAFERRRIPNLDLTRRESDGGYLYEAAQLAFCDFADGWQARDTAMKDDGGEPMRHLGNLLYMLAGLHPDDQNKAYEEALAFYNSVCPTKQVHAEEGFVLRLALASSPQPVSIARCTEAMKRSHYSVENHAKACLDAAEVPYVE